MGQRTTLYDTTLRDGTQREGLSLSVDDKLALVKRLDVLGIDYIEGGFPRSNPKDVEFFERVMHLKLRNARIVAFGSTRHKKMAASVDPGLEALLAAQTPAVCIVAKAWDLHVTEALQATLAENLEMVADSVTHLVAAGREVFVDLEHYFDGYKANAAYALEVARVAAGAGATGVVCCDTNGGTLPYEIGAIVESTVAEVARASSTCQVGMHAHNDCGCAVANTLVGVQFGANHVQGTMNGYGERAGNADLCAIIPSLVLKMDDACLSAEQLTEITATAHYVAELCNLSPDPHQPYVGASAFAHKGGIHASAIERLPMAYEHADPTLVGNLARVVVSELAGKASLKRKAAELGFDLVDDGATQTLEAIKDLEYRGYSFEAADASLSVLLEKQMGSYVPVFTLESFRVIADKREDGRVMTEATVKVLVGDERFVAVGEGNGPVNALDIALRRAIGRFYPDLAKISLKDFKVRVLDEHKGTDAVTRVLITSGDDEDSWATVGVSENIIEASWEALVDSIDYGLNRHRTAESDPPV